MAHFTHFPVTAPHPGTCLRCGNNSDIYLLGVTSFSDNILYCSRCVRELAEFAGYIDPTDLEQELEETTEKLREATVALNRIPDLTEGLINAIRNNVTDFVFAVSDGSDADRSTPDELASGADHGERETDGVGNEHINSSRKSSRK